MRLFLEEIDKKSAEKCALLLEEIDKKSAEKMQRPVPVTEAEVIREVLKKHDVNNVGALCRKELARPSSKHQ
ncbi:hypothetical protein Pint_08792 [Pistacia integerrima]|uniref:Uncharacterized protein n=1 Tax=Pistacia integerrima TaxID=434235 RepID=A0ACC0XST6_9ROSI|nr:hypothetical protein Pint_08792 [Pistacia integerrima]